MPEEEHQKEKNFIEEVVELCKKHGLSISHEDGHGAFIIESFDEHDIEWLRDTRIETKE